MTGSHAQKQEASWANYGNQAMPPKKGAIRSAKELVTTREAICDGFRELAAVKTAKATPHVKEAFRFLDELQKVDSPADLPKHPHLRESLISAAGISAKARSRLDAELIDRIILAFVEAIPEDRKPAFREEVFYRYLLIRGASLDGEMRNYIGAQAARLFVKALLQALATRHDPRVYFKNHPGFTTLPDAHLLVESLKTQKITWERHILLFDKSPRLIGKNVDLILLDASDPAPSDRRLLAEPARYLACGELKGGIDPAGADEHWKTARTALDRIRDAFATAPRQPALFFVAAAIESAMAKEIFTRLQDGRLAHTANLTVPNQVAALVSWLISL